MISGLGIQTAGKTSVGQHEHFGVKIRRVRAHRYDKGFSLSMTRTIRRFN